MPAESATVPATDEGLTRGDGAFEMVRLYGGRPFALAEHLARLVLSCEALELPCSYDQVESDVEGLIASCEATDAALRIVLTRGGHRIITIEQLPELKQAARLKSVTYAPSVVLNGVKSLSYAANMSATRRTLAAGYDEALLVSPEGTVLEAPTSAVFWVNSKGELCTPSLEVGILASITRSLVINGLNVREGEYALAELMEASEAFLASTTREIQPVSQVDDHEMECPGPLTVEAKQTLRAAIEKALGEGRGL